MRSNCRSPKFWYLVKGWPFPKQQILDSSKLKEFADDDFKFDENGWKFYKKVENSVGKGEIACYKQFSIFPTVFSKDLYSRHIKTRACLGIIKSLPKNKNLFKSESICRWKIMLQNRQ